MKRFFVFAFDRYYPNGGMDDFLGDFDTIDEARLVAENKEREYWQVLDTHTGEIT